MKKLTEIMKKTELKIDPWGTPAQSLNLARLLVLVTVYGIHKLWLTVSNS